MFISYTLILGVTEIRDRAGMIISLIERLSVIVLDMIYFKGNDFYHSLIDLSPKWPPQIHIKLSGKSIPAPERPHLVW